MPATCTTVSPHAPVPRLPPLPPQMLLAAPAGRAELERWPQYARGAIVADSAGRCHVKLGVFQFFLFWFAFYVIKGDGGGGPGVDSQLRSQSAGLTSSVRKVGRAGGRIGGRAGGRTWQMPWCLPGWVAASFMCASVRVWVVCWEAGQGGAGHGCGWCGFACGTWCAGGAGGVGSRRRRCNCGLPQLTSRQCSRGAARHCTPPLQPDSAPATVQPMLLPTLLPPAAHAYCLVCQAADALHLMRARESGAWRHPYLAALRQLLLELLPRPSSASQMGPTAMPAAGAGARRQADGGVPGVDAVLCWFHANRVGWLCPNAPL